MMGESSSLKRTIWKPQHLISNVPGVSENEEVDSKKGSFHEGKASQKKLLSEMFSKALAKRIDFSLDFFLNI